jgi:3-oxoacyl-[acyl-carrier protein] reductase
MSDLYSQIAGNTVGRQVVSRLGLPMPTTLRRHSPGDPLLPGPALIGAAPGGRLTGAVAGVLAATGSEALAADAATAKAAKSAGLRAGVYEPDDESTFAALVFDASGIADTTRLRALYDFFHPVFRRLTPSGRVIVLGTPPSDCETPRQAAAQRALEGFTRSAGKEIGRGGTAQLVHVSPGAENAVTSTLRFLLSGASAYVSGQVIRVGPGDSPEPANWERPLDGQVIVVTGASRGIGAAIAALLADQGATVICLDVPAQGEALSETANALGGSALQLDITRDDAPRVLADHLRERHGGVDVVVHNAGVTRDKTLARMTEDQWDMVLNINVSSTERIDETLVEEKLLRPGGSIVGVSSLNGIAGAKGQTNYATSKAAVIGRVEALAPQLAEQGLRINAVAPGFIETAMTAAMPVGVREAGRRLNSMSQGGLPEDVAQTVAWLASPASGGVNGNVVRVCGQSLIGA